MKNKTIIGIISIAAIIAAPAIGYSIYMKARYDALQKNYLKNQIQTYEIIRSNLIESAKSVEICGLLLSQFDEGFSTGGRYNRHATNAMHHIQVIEGLLKDQP